MARLLIVGATGLVGNLVVRQAIADTRVSRVIALTRRPLAPADKVQNVVVDFSNLPNEAEWWSVDGVVSALGTTRAAGHSPSAYRAIEIDYPLAVARCARDHGATRFALTTALGADPGSRFLYTRTKGELECEMKKLGFPSLTIVRPSVLEGDRGQQRLVETMAQTMCKLLAPLLPRRLRISHAADVAATLLNGAIEAPPGVHIRTNETMAHAPH
jgi:uncharacterized protein YbjT (DUF2867 family)